MSKVLRRTGGLLGRRFSAPIARSRRRQYGPLSELHREHIKAVFNTRNDVGHPGRRALGLGLLSVLRRQRSARFCCLQKIAESQFVLSQRLRL